MTYPFAHDMAKATELTKSGRLQEAVALIQSRLSGHTDTPAPIPADDALDGTFTRLADVAPAQAQPARPRKTPGLPRSGLAETMRKIAAGGMPSRGPLSRAPQSRVTQPLPPGARFLSLTHATAQGSRDYRLYIPARQSDGPMPLIVMLHGCTQTPEDFALGTGMNRLAEEFGCLVAYPAQTSAANAQKCWNWFRPEDQHRDRGEPALIAGLTRAILHDHPADPARIYIAGLSAGGAAAAIIAAAYPDLFSAVGVHSGLAAGAAQDVASAFAAMRTGAAGQPQRSAIPTIVFHGLADTTVHPDNGAAVANQALKTLPKLQRTTVKGTSTGGTTYRQTRHAGPEDRSMVEHWEISGAGHAWAGGDAQGSHTDPKGPDASREMLRFFLQHTKA